MLKRFLKNERGLTLIELLAVIVILGIIAAIAIPTIGNIIDNSKKDAHVANAEEIINAARLAKTQDTSGTNSWSLNDLVKGGFLESIPKSPGNKGAYDPDNSTVTFVPAAANASSYYQIKLKASDNGAGYYINTDNKHKITRDDVSLDATK
ncbi:prepilin-type N-terminal cleavage/methylation domain-containing protein [Anoxybacteroides tepidamans]|uniref:prepilin-type N-terminal cleavage/methylation domain-containing protein n=1 Tax=Anoxybacteroides tepidamans TaxID=265948 RepID=UPI00048135A5|nr:prepilin-type N-terminal cleavage/methylation domain-containing protein [Anoxybacillus tepidamans]